MEVLLYYLFPIFIYISRTQKYQIISAAAAAVLHIHISIKSLLAVVVVVLASEAEAIPKKILKN